MHRESHRQGSWRNKTFLLGNPGNHAGTCRHKAKPAVHSRPTHGAAWYHTKHHITACRKLAFFCPGQLAGLPPDTVRTQSPKLVSITTACTQLTEKKHFQQTAGACSDSRATSLRQLRLKNILCGNSTNTPELQKTFNKSPRDSGASWLKGFARELAPGPTYPNANVPGITGTPPPHCTAQIAGKRKRKKLSNPPQFDAHPRDRKLKASQTCNRPRQAGTAIPQGPSPAGTNKRGSTGPPKA